MLMLKSATVFALSFLLAFVATNHVVSAANHTAGVLDCTSGVRQFDPMNHKEVYHVGVHAAGGSSVAVTRYGKTFEEYLTATAGKRFDPPIEFKMVATRNPMHSWVDDPDQEVDFYYSDSGIYSCMGVEAGVEPIATTVSNFKVRGHEFNLDVFAGVIFTLADRDDIDVIADIKGKRVAAMDIGDFAGAQAQFYAMHAAGMDHIMDPKQVVFTGNHFEVVKGVLSGEFDVGFVRTGIIERTLLDGPDEDSEKELVDPEVFKVIDPRLQVLDDGNLFPFLHSTQVFAEWPFYTNADVPRDVIEEVSAALIALNEHQLVGELIDECNAELEPEVCDGVSVDDLYPSARCDTSKELATLAYQAGKAGHHKGFRAPMSYFNILTMQQAGEFVVVDESGDWKCNRLEELRKAIECPEGHYKLNQEDFDGACEQIGMPCPEDSTCYCAPCVEAFEVDLYEWTGEGNETTGRPDGCDKMSLCAAVEQAKTIKFHAYDNVQRQNANIRALMHIGSEAIELDVLPLTDSDWTYEFSFTYPNLGIGILEFFVNGKQIPQSPIRIRVVPRECDLDFPGQNKEASDDGSCVCESDTVKIGDKCVSSVIFFVVVSVGAVLIVLLVGAWYLGYKKRQSDQLWLVSVDELHFDVPVEIIGQGSFGVVLLAEYRGTKVAIKRVLPVGEKKKGLSTKSGSNGSCSKEGGSMFGTASLGSVANKDSSKGTSSFLQETDSDVEAQKAKASSFGNKSFGTIDSNSIQNSSASLGGNLDFLGDLSFGQKRTKLQIMFPWCFPEHRGRSNVNILGSASGGTGNASSTVMSRIFPWLSQHGRQKAEFVLEMRLLSRLRHPCITTVMGAVINPVTEPMLVMEFMEYGSLHDLLRNDTMHAGGEIILQICRDVAQGLRYLHASRPPILHGDLKARNILIDSRFRAKVADFGLSTKKKRGLSGTPYFLAPEYLRGKTEYNMACDIYSVGIILFEIYARKDPYAGENPRQVLRKVCDPRVNKRPGVPDSCPPKMADVMKKCWSPDPFFRPQAKDLDLVFMDMNVQEVEPGVGGTNTVFKKPKEIKSEDMLYEVFPRHVADALKAGTKVEPEQHDLVTVVFSDIVHFTDISNSISALKVSQMLDRLYMAFDLIARKHKVFKVETIGDAYMGVTNLDGSEEETHVKQVAEFAIDLIAKAGEIMIDEDDPKRGYIRIRVGFHSGPVVSNVIGSLNPRYGLFGDTVNTASRMESNSYSRKIHCSERSAKLLAKQAPEVPLFKRGKIGVKGKGEMMTYWVGSSASAQGASADKEVGCDDGKAHVGFVETA